jgi:hypothetical protein
LPRISKLEAENAIMERFVSAFHREYGIKLRSIVHRDKPDYSAFDPSRNITIGIEITGVYQDDEEAKIQYWALDEWDLIIGSLEQIIARINEGIEKKVISAENYQFKQYLVLAIWIGSLVFNERRDMDFIKQELIIPKNVFRDIWLIIQNFNDHSPELYRLQ